MGLNEKDDSKYSPFSTNKATKGKKLTIKDYLAIRIDLTARVNLNDTLEEAFRKATTKYFCSCGTQISYADHERYDGQCKPCYRIDSSNK